MAEEEQGDSEKRLSIIKIYLKDFSFESPLAPEVFKESDWAPKTNLNMRSAHTAVDDKYHEVVLTITVEAKDSDKDKTLCLIELNRRSHEHSMTQSRSRAQRKPCVSTRESTAAKRRWVNRKSSASLAKLPPRSTPIPESFRQTGASAGQSDKRQASSATHSPAGMSSQ